MLEIKSLDSWYNNVQVLHGVNLHVNKAEIVTIIGPNGAGKSTVLKSVFGSVTKCKGNILFEGKNIIKYSPGQLVKLGISFVPQGRSIFPNLTVLENLEMGVYPFPRIDGHLNSIYSMFKILKERKGTRAGLLSGGEQQMLAIARALMLNPRMMLLDEPSLGLSPKMKKEIFDRIIEINKTGVTMLIVEQNARLSLAMSNRAYVLELGRNKMTGNASELLHNKEVEHLYLGGII